MLKIIFIVAGFTAATSSAAQKSFKQNALYGEILGAGLVLSVNYERQMADEPGFGVHAGIGLGSSKPIIPLGISYLLSIKSKKSFIELGANITIAEKNLWSDEFLNPVTKNSYSPGFIPAIGYRYHSRKSFLLRVNYTPIFNKYRSEFYFFGIAAGWRL